MAGTDVAVRTVSERIASEEMSAKIASAVGNRALAKRIQRAALTAIQTNPELLAGGVTQGSVYTALLRCAQDGLLPDGREAAFVRRGKEIVYQPMVGGFRKRAAAHGFTLEAQVVHAGDDFDYELGIYPTLRHKPPQLGVDRGAIIGAYAIARNSALGTFIEVMPRDEIEQVRKASSAGERGPWSSWWGEMARKTVARRLFKQLPLGVDDADVSVLEADEIAFGPFADLPKVDPRELDEPVVDALADVIDGEATDVGPNDAAEDQGHFKIPDGATSGS